MSRDRRTRRAGEVLVAGQVALTLMILVGAGLTGRSLFNLQRLDPGFAPEGLTLVELVWPWGEMGSREAVWDFYDRVVPRVEALASVSDATPVLLTPFSGTGGWSGRFVTEAQTDADAGRNPWLNMEVGGSAYFRTFALPILRGRGFTAADREDAPSVVVVGASTAGVLWPDEDPIGKRVRLLTESGPDAWRTVVGVAADTRYRAFREPSPTIYLPYRQFTASPIVLAVRGAREIEPSGTTLRSTIEEADARVSVWKATPMSELMAGPLARPRITALLLWTFAGAALLMAALGLYGVLAYAVGSRTPELRIRLAVGADPRALRMLVMRRAVALVAAGAACGVVGVLAGGRVLASVLFEISPTDPFTLALVCVVLLAVAVAASYLPARRATRVDPARVLRGP
jgi:predicted permease